MVDTRDVASGGDDASRAALRDAGRDKKTPACVVGIGASAGGLDALERFFEPMPLDTGLAFVVIEHLSPNFESMMDELLARRTKMAIHRVEHRMPIEPNAIYLIPPKKELEVSDGKLALKDVAEGLSLPVDVFFRSLAKELGSRAVGVVLSGTGTDGSRGVREIHEAGGLVLVQQVDTAKFDGMPRSAIDAGVANFVLAPDRMHEILVKHISQPYPTDTSPASIAQPRPEDGELGGVFALLLERYGIDFAHYKPGTMTRRIENRVAMSPSPNLQEYVDGLRTDAIELNALYKDLLIGVTQFLRDREAFESLQRNVIPNLFEKVAPHDDIRVWVAGCATGEEAYSLAILLHEHGERLGRERGIKLFATDVHKASLDTASAGLYEQGSLVNVAPARLDRYFTKQDGHFQVIDEVRDMIVFAPHNMLQDPPFMKQDLVSCRNLLIYFQPAVQKRTLAMLHYALKVGGTLFLGPSESVAALDDAFEAVDGRWRIYRKARNVDLPPEVRLPLVPATTRRVALKPRVLSQDTGIPATSRLLRAYDTMLADAIPPSLLVNDQYQIVHSFGDARRYVRPPEGRMSTNIVDMVEDDNLRIALGAAMQRAVKEQKQVVYRDISVQSADDGGQLLKLTVKPLPDQKTDSTFLLISFESSQAPPPTELPDDEEDAIVEQASSQRVQVLENELLYTKETLQTTVEELQTSNEELQATNEELVASNEELQSTNEELHSVNEELHSVNEEHQRKIEELTQLTNDIDNLLRSTEIGTVFLDLDLSIRKFTPAIGRAFHLLPRDIGRPIFDLSMSIDDEHLLDEIHEVVLRGHGIEREVTNRDETPFLMRILPYQTGKGATEGVVLTFVDITLVKQAEERFRMAVEGSLDAIVIVSREGEIVLANRRVEQLFGYSRDEVLGQQVELLLPERVRARHREQRKTFFENPKPVSMSDRQGLSARRKDGSEFRVEVSLSPIRMRDGLFVLAAASDITLREEARQQLERYAAELKRSNEDLQRFAYAVSHDLQEPLRAVTGFCELLQQEYGGQLDASADEYIREAVDGAHRMRELLRGLLAYSRVETRGKVLQATDCNIVFETAVSNLRNAIETSGAQVTGEPLPTVMADQTQLEQLFQNLISNGIKYCGDQRPEIHVSADRTPEGWRFGFRDNGIGIDPQYADRIFVIFQRLHTRTKYEGLGIGLSLCKRIVERHGGHIWVESEPGGGSTFYFTIPSEETDRERRNP